MGANQSKTSRKVLKAKAPSHGTDSPNEKHNSADSNAPLAKHAAAHFALPRDSSIDRHQSTITTTTARNSHTTPSIHLGDEIETIPANTNHPRSSTAAEANTTQVNIDDIQGHSNVSRPPPPPRMHTLSELIDPEELLASFHGGAGHVRSPSGNLLGPAQFLAHPHRPRSIRERQERIRERMRAERERSWPVTPPLESSERGAGRAGDGSGGEMGRKKRGCFGCFSA